MRLAQLLLPNGETHGAVVRGDLVSDIGRPTLEFFEMARESGVPVAELLRDARGTSRPYSFSSLLEGKAADGVRLTMPVCPPEMWGCGVTYKRSAEFRDDDSQTSKGIYDYVYSAPRPETFFKGRAAHCVGPNEAIGLRSDSVFTAPEPELALVLSRTGEIVGYTVANDVSAWDIERENPLYLPQSKIFRGCCAIGPVIVTPDELVNPNDLMLTARILRDEQVTFEGSVRTSRIGRSFSDLIHYLTLDNPIPDGTIVCTGTGVIVTAENALEQGDTVEITIEGIGTLRNPCARLGRTE